MPATPIEIGLGQMQGIELAQAVATDRRKLVEQAVERPSFRGNELGFAIERVERLAVAVGQKTSKRPAAPSERWRS